MKIGDNCATWNCKGKVIGNGKREDGSLMDVKCPKCGREYWHDNMSKLVNTSKIKTQNPKVQDKPLRS